MPTIKDYAVGICSGYFDPLHAGHVEYLEIAKERCNYLIVIINTDAQAILKKGFVAIPENDRIKIVRALRVVDHTFLSIDTDGSVCQSLERLRADYSQFKRLFFFKGGDRFATEIPEAAICRKLGIKMMDGLGKKVDSSTRINVISRSQE